MWLVSVIDELHEEIGVLPVGIKKDLINELKLYVKTISYFSPVSRIKLGKQQTFSKNVKMVLTYDGSTYDF